MTLVLSAVDLLQIAAKVFSYAGALGAFGAIAFLQVFDGALLHPEHRRIRRYAAVLLAVALLGSLLMLFGTVALLNGRGLGGGFDGELWSMVAATPVGDSVWLRIAGLAVLSAGLVLPGLRLVAVLLGGLIVTASFGFVGHLRDEEYQLILHALLVLHLLGVGFWIGSLWPLIRLAGEKDLPRVAGIMERFGRLAVFIVALLVAAGLGMAWLLLGEPSRLVTTDYGRVLLVKLALVALLLGLAALNKLKLTPSLAAGQAGAALSLQRSIRLEIALVFLLLGVTALLTAAFSPL